MNKAILIICFLLHTTVHAEDHRVYISNNTQEVIPHVRIKVTMKGWQKYDIPELFLKAGAPKTENVATLRSGSVHIFDLYPAGTQVAILEKAKHRHRSSILPDPKCPHFYPTGGKKLDSWSPLGAYLQDTVVTQLCRIIVDTETRCSDGCTLTRKGKGAECHDNADFSIWAAPTKENNQYEVIKENGKVVVKALK